MIDPGDPSKTSALLRFAVLHHSGIESPHYDLLFESTPGSQLTTFRLAQWPPADGDEVTRLRDHRRLYLTYEGPVPGERGRVDRIVEGALTANVDRAEISLTISSPEATLHFVVTAVPETWIVSKRK